MTSWSGVSVARQTGRRPGPWTLTPGPIGEPTTLVAAESAATSIGYRAGTSAATNSTQLSVPVPVSIQAGDLLFLIVAANRTDVTVSGPASWTELDRVADSSLQSIVWSRMATAVDLGSTLTVRSTLNTKLSAHVLAYSGAGERPIVTHTTRAEPGTSATHQTPVITVPPSGGWLLSYWADKSQTGTGWTTPSAVVHRLQSVLAGGGRVTAVSADSGAPVAAGTAGGISAVSSASSSMATMWSIVIAPDDDAPPPPPVLRFVDDAVSAGIYEVNESWEAVPVDYDRDGDLDLWIGLHDQGAKLWSNDDDGTFTRVASTAWPKVNRYGRIPDRHTCAFADVDGDGDVDAYCAAGRGGDNPVKYNRENELWLQTGPGVFTEVGRQWGVGDLCGRSHYVAFLNANGDPYPDLFLGNAPPRDDPADPCNDPANQLPSEESKLFINSGGTALVPTTTMGIGGYGGGRCTEVVDFNGDGWDDLLVCGNPATYLFANQRGTGFIDVAPAQGLSGNVSDAVMGDLDGDGDPDLLTINWSNVTYRLNDNGVFRPAVNIAVLNPGGGRSVDMGDADGDGDLDVYALRANGTQNTNPDDILFLNDHLTFAPVPVPAASGVGDAVTALDIDGDGATEFVVLNGQTFGPIQLLRLTTE